MTFSLAVLLALQVASSSDRAANRTEETKTVPLYTNDDLDRVHSRRDETGVSSVPAFAPAAPGARARPAVKPRGHGEEYWRKEAARVREKVASLRSQAAELRARLAEREAERRHTLGRPRAGSTSEAGLKARLSGIESRIRSLEDELRDRARRLGALPGWLR